MIANTPAPAPANGAVKKKLVRAKAVFKKPARAKPVIKKKPVRVSDGLFRHSCRSCPYVAAYSSDRVARSARDRHERETHGTNAQRARISAHRQLQSARYMTANRRDERGDDPKMDCVEDVVVYILCTTRREDEHCMFTDTKDHLIASGFHRANIHQLRGADVRVNGDIGKSQCVMWAFLHRFIPNASSHFAKFPKTRYVLFCEDDVRLEKGSSAKDVNEEAMHAYPTACRMGWYNSGGHTNYGCQMASFSLEAIQHFKKITVNMLYSCDLWWGSVKDEQMPSGVTLMKIARKNFARQHNHPLRGRN